MDVMFPLTENKPFQFPPIIISDYHSTLEWLRRLEMHWKSLALVVLVAVFSMVLSIYIRLWKEKFPLS